jgi:hypothetical protein
MKRPIGVTVIAVFFMVSATALPAFVLLSLRKDATIFSKSLLMLISLIEFALSMGLWKMRNWARISTAALVILGFLNGMASLRHVSLSRSFTPWFLAEYVLVFGIDLWIILYLLRPKIRHAFLISIL